MTFDDVNFKLYFFDSNANKRKCQKELNERLRKKEAEKQKELKRSEELKKEQETELIKKRERHYYLDYKISKLRGKIQFAEDVEIPGIKSDIEWLEIEQKNYEVILNDTDSFFDKLLEPDYSSFKGLNSKPTLEKEYKELCSSSLQLYKSTTSSIFQYDKDISYYSEAIKKINNLPIKLIGQTNYRILNPKDPDELGFISKLKSEVKVVRKDESNGLFSTSFIEPITQRFSNIKGLATNTYINAYYVIYDFESRLHGHNEKIKKIEAEKDKAEQELAQIKENVIAKIQFSLDQKTKALLDEKKAKVNEKIEKESEVFKFRTMVDKFNAEFYPLDRFLSSLGYEF